MSMDTPRHITLGQFTIAFVPAGLLLAWALLQPEMGAGDLETGRTRLMMWAVTLMLMPALALYLFRNTGRTIANLSHLFWTAALLLFLVHTYWGAFIFYNGIADTFSGQGVPLASANFALLAVWVADTILLWFGRESRSKSVVHSCVRLLVFVLFAVDLLVGRTGAAHTLGYVFVGVLLLLGLIRLVTARVEVTA
jgi:hypothetical protein